MKEKKVKEIMNNDKQIRLNIEKKYLNIKKKKKIIII